MTPDLATVDAAGLAQTLPVVQLAHNASLTDIAAFQSALGQAEAAGGPAKTVTIDAVNPTMASVMQALESINAEAAGISARAEAAAASNAELTPGEMIMLTVRCHEFLFHCQLTSNVANRTSDGLQQLFRQQS